jgi:hypothetical protein
MRTLAPARAARTAGIGGQCCKSARPLCKSLLLLAITAAQLLLLLLMLPRFRNLGADAFQNQTSGPQISDFFVLRTPHASTRII